MTTIFLELKTGLLSKKYIISYAVPKPVLIKLTANALLKDNPFLTDGWSGW